jgi:hypothetical protein
MGEMTFVVSTPRRLPERLAILAGVVAVGTAWWLVIQQLRSVEPVASHIRPSAVVWNERVFTSSEQLQRWLTARGIDYAKWSADHPGALRIVDKEAYRKQLRTQVDWEFAAAPQATTEAGPADEPSWYSGLPLPGLSVLLALLATILWTLAALPYRALARRYILPSWLTLAREYRFYLVAAAAAVSLGVATGAAGL